MVEFNDKIMDLLYLNHCLHNFKRFHHLRVGVIFRVTFKNATKSDYEDIQILLIDGQRGPKSYSVISQQ
jgi:hypothetical protein